MAEIGEPIVDNQPPTVIGNNVTEKQESDKPATENKSEPQKPTEPHQSTDVKEENHDNPQQPPKDTDESADTILKHDNNDNQQQAVVTEKTVNQTTIAKDAKPSQTVETPQTQAQAQVKQFKISAEETHIYNQISTEKVSITKCIDNMVQSLTTFETNSEQKKALINDIFSSIITSINNRKATLINELNNDILTQKSQALKQIESLKQYLQILNHMDAKYQSLTNPQQNDDDEKMQQQLQVEKKQEILSLSKQFDPQLSKMEFTADIKLKFETEQLETLINTFGSVRIGKATDPEYDEEKVPAFIDTNTELLLAEIPVKKIYRWTLKSGEDYSWSSRAQRTIILFYQNKKSYKVRMLVKENESETLLMNQWVSTKPLVEKEAMVWVWSSFDATIAKEEGDEKKGYTKWCAKFFDDVAFERFEDQYNQARKINIQVLDNEEKIRQNKLKQQRLRKQEQERLDSVNMDIEDEDVIYYENDEKLCFEMDVWKTYLWSKDAAGKGAWKAYAEKSVLQFFENRKNKKIRIVLRENETKELKLNHWIPCDVALKSRGDQMWEWQVYDDLATKFLKNSTLKLATICATFIDKKDTDKFKELFEKYQKINQQAEAM